MSNPNLQPIPCIFSTSDDIPIYDADNIDSQQQQSPNRKSSNTKQNKNSQHQAIIQSIDQQIQSSKTNFFNIQFNKKIQNKNKCIQLVENIQYVLQKYPTSIIKQSYLYKKNNSILFKWKMRYFVLNSEKLYFFENHQKNQIVGCVNFKILPTKIIKQKQQITLDFGGECENVILKCQDKKQRDSWVLMLSEVLRFQAKQQKLLLKTMIKPLYDCRDSITEKQFNQIAETGDILLFYTRNTGAKIQRIITNSDFDHVAMVVKLQKNQIMVFQSNQAYGVSIYQWNQYIRYFNLYDKATLRKLHSLRKQQYHNTLLTFIKKNLGKKYDISAKKLLKLQSDFNWDQIKQQESRGYFCSQLIAKAYKSIGLINKKKFCGRYWPVDFTQKEKLELRNGAFLGSEINIVLNRNIKSIL